MGAMCKRATPQITLAFTGRSRCALSVREHSWLAGDGAKHFHPQVKQRAIFRPGGWVAQRARIVPNHVWIASQAIAETGQRKNLTNCAVRLLRRCKLLLCHTWYGKGRSLKTEVLIRPPCLGRSKISIINVMHTLATF